jgi:hypothetical protein
MEISYRETPKSILKMEGGGGGKGQKRTSTKKRLRFK